jgi:hypothetical protein
VFAFDESCCVASNLQNPSGAHPETAGPTEVGGPLYIQCLHSTTLSVFDRRAAGL